MYWGKKINKTFITIEVTVFDALLKDNNVLKKEKKGMFQNPEKRTYYCFHFVSFEHGTYIRWQLRTCCARINKIGLI